MHLTSKRNGVSGLRRMGTPRCYLVVKVDGISSLVGMSPQCRRGVASSTGQAALRVRSDVVGDGC